MGEVCPSKMKDFPATPTRTAPTEGGPNCASDYNSRYKEIDITTARCEKPLSEKEKRSMSPQQLNELQDAENELFEAKLMHAWRLLKVAEQIPELREQALRTRARLLSPYHPIEELFVDVFCNVQSLFAIRHDCDLEEAAKRLLTDEAIAKADELYGEYVQ
jgi:hypothetical protein